MGHLQVWFDYSSPFGYLATTQVERIADAHDATLEWRPFLLGALFKRIGTPLVPIASMPEAKRSYVRKDMQRWADHWGVPLRWPSGFPLRTVTALRMTLVAPADGRAALIHRLMRLCWVEDGDPDDADALGGCAEDAGLSRSLVDEAGAPEARLALRQATEEAELRGCPGVPTFFVSPAASSSSDDLMFWGQDRLTFVEKALDGWRPSKG